MNPADLGGPLTLVLCAAALVALAPTAFRQARAAYAASLEAPPPRPKQPVPRNAARAPRRIFVPDDPVRPMRPAA